MIARKKRKILIITLIVIIILIITAIMITLYLTTDMFKSNSTLFTKYMGQNFENIGYIYSGNEQSEFEELLKQNTYTTETQISVNYAEDTENPINQLKLEISEETDNNNFYNHKDINLLNNDEKITEIEYIQSENTYGLLFNDMFNQYVLVNNEDLKDLFKKIGYSEEQLSEVPNQIEFNNDFSNIFEFTDEEKESLKTKYLNIINNSISKNKFSKQSNQSIDIDGQKIKANAYILTLTKEQINNLFIKIFEELKEEEIILNRLDKIQEILNQYQLNNENDSLREQFIQKIESITQNIVKNNIGQDECKIIVYEDNEKTVKTTIQTTEYELNLELLPTSKERYIRIYNKDITNKKENIYIYRKNSEETSFVIRNIENGKTKEYSFTINENIDGNNCNKNIIAKYQDNENTIEAKMEQEIEIVEEFEYDIVLNTENSINLSELETEQVQQVIERVNTKLAEKMNELSTKININDLTKVLIVTGIVDEEQKIESEGVTETERNRFNSKFEILQGKNLKDENILNLINAVKDNLIELEVVSNTQLRLKLDRLKSNQDAATTLSTFIENNKGRTYNATIEYDDTTGLVRDILLTLEEKK